jgi:uncharacterized membrane protein HdeD (DUF308 family)
VDRTVRAFHSAPNLIHAGGSGGARADAKREAANRATSRQLLDYVRTVTNGVGVTLLSGPYAAAAVLLVIAGAPKVVKPGTTVLALRSVKAPASATAVRIFGAVEVLIGLAAVTVGGRIPAVLVATSYLAFAAFVAYALARGGVLSSCGCFGKPDTPPTRLHIVTNIAAAATAIAVAVNPPDRLADIVTVQPMHGAPFLALTAVCVWFVYLALAELPKLRPQPIATAGRVRR